MKPYKILLPLLLLATLYACKKDRNNHNVASLSSFPLAAGDIWNYQLYDSINNTTQNATFKITGSVGLNGPIVYLTQTIINNVVVDSGTIEQSGDTIFYQPNGQGLFSNLTLLVPMQANQWWHTQYTADSVYVVAANFNYSVAGNNYDSVFEVGRTEIVPDLYIHQDVYIAQHVGIIQVALNQGSWIQVRKSIKLVSYSLH